ILSSTARLQRSKPVEAIAYLFSLVVAISAAFWLPDTVLASWQKTAQGHLSPAGWWHVLISAPALLVLLLGWAWRLFLWGRFLYLCSRLDIQLIASHPDGSAGLKFVGQSLASFALLGFAIGALAAGFVADQVADGESLLTFKFLPLYLALAVLAVFTL